MKAFKRFFGQFDMFAAPPTLRAKQEPRLASTCAGMISFICGLFFTYLFIASSIQVFNYAKIDSAESESTIKASEANGEFPMLGIDNLSLSQAQAMFQINVMTNNQIIRMVQCTPEHWKFLGDDYKQKYYQNYLNNFFCPNVSSQKRFTLNQTMRSLKNQFVVIMVQPCIEQINSTCISGKSEQYLDNATRLSGGSTFYLNIGEVSLSPQQKDAVSYTINTNTKRIITRKFGSKIMIGFSTFQVQTDIGLMPIQQIQISKGIKIDNIRTSLMDINQMDQKIYVYAIFTMNQKKKTFKRKVGKLDELLSYSGGLFSIIIGFVASFNEYRYELMVAESTFNYDDEGKTVGETQFNFFVYIKYTIYDWIKTLFCIQLRWQDCQEIDQTREEANCQIDVTRLFRRIKNIEMGLSHCLGKNEKTCINMLQHPTLTQMKRERLMIDYYHAVIGNGSSLTVNDVRMINRTCRLGLKICEQYKDPTPIASTSAHNRSVSPISIVNYTEHEILTHRRIQSSHRIEKLITEKQKKMPKKGSEETVEEVMSMFPQLRLESESIELPEELKHIEQQIVYSFNELTAEMREKLEGNVPLKILFRLKKQGNKSEIQY